MADYKVRNCKELGVNMQKIVTRLMANDNLVKLLYYYKTDDPLSQPALTDEQKKTLIFNKLIKLTPRLDPTGIDQSMISVMARTARSLGSNDQFRDIVISVEVFVPISQWMIKDTNLRPYAIMGEIQESLSGKTVNGLGKIRGGDFDYNYGTDEITGFAMDFYITEYD